MCAFRCVGVATITTRTELCCTLFIKERASRANSGSRISSSLHGTLPGLVFAPLFCFRLSALLFAVLCSSGLVSALHASASFVSASALVSASASHSSRPTSTKIFLCSYNIFIKLKFFYNCILYLRADFLSRYLSVVFNIY